MFRESRQTAIGTVAVSYSRLIQLPIILVSPRVCSGLCVTRFVGESVSALFLFFLSRPCAQSKVFGNECLIFKEQVVFVELKRNLV